MAGPGEQLLHLVVDGEAATKKNTQRVTYPKLYGLGLRHGGAHVNSPKLFMTMIAALCRTNPAQAAAIADSAIEAFSPRLQPSSEFTRWKKRALGIMGNAMTMRPKPLLPEGNLGAVRVIVYMAAGQTGDLINFEQAVWDVLQDAAIIRSDYWLNGHADSERRWSEPLKPRVEITLFDVGPRPDQVPEVRVEGLAAARDRMGPLTFHIHSPRGGAAIRDLTAPRDISRDRLAMEAARIWRERAGEPLPVGALVQVVDPAAAAQLRLV